MASKRALYLFREAQYHEAETRILELRSANYETTVALTIVAPLLIWTIYFAMVWIIKGFKNKQGIPRQGNT